MEEAIHPVVITKFERKQSLKELKEGQIPVELLINKLKEEINALRWIVDFIVAQLNERDIQLTQAKQQYTELEHLYKDLRATSIPDENTIDIPLDRARSVKLDLPKPYKPDSPNIKSFIEKTREYKERMDNISSVVHRDRIKQKKEFEDILKHEVSKTARVSYNMHETTRSLPNDPIRLRKKFLHKDIVQRIKERLIRSYRSSIIYKKDNLLDLMNTEEFTSEISEHDRALIFMVSTLSKYNTLLQKLLTQNTPIKHKQRYDELIIKNTNLKANIKDLLSHQYLNPIEEYLVMINNDLTEENDRLLAQIDKLLT